MASKFTIDLNQPPPIINHESHNEEELPISVTPTSAGNIVIEQNEENHNDGASSDSSAEEIIVDQIETNSASATANGEQGMMIPLFSIIMFSFHKKKKCKEILVNMVSNSVVL